MKEFIIRVLKWLASLAVAYFILFLLFFFVLAMIGVAFQPETKTVKDNSILTLNLGFNLTDRPEEETPAQILQSAMRGEMPQTASLRQVVEGINAARLDPKIHGLHLTGNMLIDGYGGSFAALREVRRAIRSFAEDKPVYAYIKGDTLRDLYVKSAATEIISNPFAIADFRGLRAERLYLGDAFERIGIEVQVEAFEEYKTAGEAFQSGVMSEHEREQLVDILDDLWSVIVEDIAEARGLDRTALDAVASNELILFGPEIPATGFSDRQLSVDEFIDYLSGKTAFDPDTDSFRQFDFLEYLDLNQPAIPRLEELMGNNQIAVIYAEGILVDGEGVDGTIGSAELIRILREARNDEAVKAIVLRINSPGGSATASFKVVRELSLTNAEKPVVASMGGIATSAGYMIAAPCDQIFAEPSTITGSIGVVMMLANLEGLAEKLSVQFEGVETHPFAGTFSIARSKTPEEMEQFRSLGSAFYMDFLNVVAENRDLSLSEVKTHAKGRVWSGMAAREFGLIDEHGGLIAAINRAADLAGIGDDYTIIERPRVRTLEEQIQELFSAHGSLEPKLRNAPLREAFDSIESEIHRLSVLNDPMGQYAILPYTLKIN